MLPTNGGGGAIHADAFELQRQNTLPTHSTHQSQGTKEIATATTACWSQSEVVRGWRTTGYTVTKVDAVSHHASEIARFNGDIDVARAQLLKAAGQLKKKPISQVPVPPLLGMAALSDDCSANYRVVPIPCLTFPRRIRTVCCGKTCPCRSRDNFFARMAWRWPALKRTRLLPCEEPARCHAMRYIVLSVLCGKRSCAPRYSYSNQSRLVWWCWLLAAPD